MSVEFKFKDKEKWKFYPLSKLYQTSAFFDAFPWAQKLLSDSEDLKSTQLEFVVYQTKIGLYDPENSMVLPMTFDASKSYGGQKKFDKSKEPLFMGLKNHKQKLIVDVTGGLLVDSFRLLGANYRVLSYEQNPILHVLIHSELNFRSFDNFEFRAKRFDWSELNEVQEEFVVIYDPYFRKKKDKSSPKGPMQILKKLDMTEENLNFPHLSKKFPILVKRPIKAPELWPGVIAKYKGKSVRYDLYNSN